MSRVFDGVALQSGSSKNLDTEHRLAVQLPAIRTSFDRLAKRTLDTVVAAAALLLLSPLMLAIASAIWIAHGGPIILAHRRIGKNGRPFACLKFRTMVRDAEAMLEQHLLNDPDARREWQLHQKLTDDPRVTRFGRYLRATNLDELPQLINVLKGDMSLVGPRPIVADEVARYGDRFAICFSVAPGITGLWQIRRSTARSYDDRIALDASYVAQRSTLLDLAILTRTIPAAFFRRGI